MNRDQRRPYIPPPSFSLNFSLAKHTKPKHACMGQGVVRCLRFSCALGFGTGVGMGNKLVLGSWEYHNSLVHSCYSRPESRGKSRDIRKKNGEMFMKTNFSLPLVCIQVAAAAEDIWRLYFSFFVVVTMAIGPQRSAFNTRIPIPKTKLLPV